MLAACAGALAVCAPVAVADTPLPDARTHVDPAGVEAAGGNPDSPKLTFIKSDTTARDVRSGYLYVRVRCDARCEVEVTATIKVGSKTREVGTASKTLPANTIRRVKVRIRSAYRARLAAGAKFRFNVQPLPALD